ncbi:MAG: ClpXP protease specificity-enhancing factor SspB [Spirochaetia bacterium]|nr:ClpXP protease specificity-enhancing factor SspB [Spirochaetia bacterium]
MDTSDISPEELVLLNRKLKKSILDVLFSNCDTFYIHCMPNPLLQVGKRGLIDKEKTEGIILVFGPYSTRHLDWDDRSIQCEMQFGKWEYVNIPFECIARMFDKSGQVIMQWATMVSPEPLENHRSEPQEMQSKTESRKKTVKKKKEKNGAVIEVDFSKKKEK